ncbi:MAG: hypothetical protein ACOC56_06820 [Atribacterota bacterium]
MSPNKNLKIKKANFFLSPYEPTIRDETIFGLGPSRFVPSSNTVQITTYSSNPSEILLNDAFAFLPVNSTFCHEMGHYQLTTSSRLGSIIKDLNIILDGLCLIVIKRMIKRHGKIWIPFSRYLNFKNKDKNISQLINNASSLEAFITTLISNWQITQELFAYSWTGFLTTLWNSLWTRMIGEENRTKIFSTIASLGLDDDYKKITEINEKLRGYFIKKDIQFDEIGQEEIEELFENIHEIFGEEADLVEAYLKLYESLLFVHRDEKTREGLDKTLERFLEKYKKETDIKFEKGYSQHVEALKIFKNISIGTFSDFLIIMAGLTGISYFYTPVIKPELIKHSLEKEKVKEMDQLSVNTIEQLLKGGINLSDPNSINSFISRLHEEINSIKIDEINKIPLFNIFGTRKWFFRLISNLDLNNKEKKFVKRMLIGNRAIDQNKNFLPPYESLLSLTPISLRLLIRIIFRIRKLLTRWKWAKSIFEFLEKLHIKKASILFRFFEIYQDAFLSPPFSMILEQKDKGKGFAKPPFAVYFDKKNTILYSDKDFSEPMGKLSIYKHIIGNLKELCLKGRHNTIICPISYLKGSDNLCTNDIGNCWISKLLKMSPKKGNLLICCRDGKAAFLRLYKRANDPVLVSKFRIDDREAERKRKRGTPTKDVIDQIWKPQLDRINNFSKKEKGYRKESDKIAEEKKYDGKLDDISYENYFKRRMERKGFIFIDSIFKSIKVLLFPLYFPIKMDIGFHKLILKRKNKKIRMSIDKTEKELKETLELISQIE